jgi:hypothetical protein
MEGMRDCKFNNRLVAGSVPAGPNSMPYEFLRKIDLISVRLHSIEIDSR